jgi:[ribosomal protein S5]-alanine N-acetyltransferase
VLEIRTARLTLIAATPRHLQAELVSNAAFQTAIGCTVPDSWPPELYDHDAINWTLRMLASVPDMQRWAMHYVIEGAHGGTVVGTAGFKGPPDETGTVEIGYGILQEYRRKGYATEAARALIETAFADARVTTVIAETLPHLTASIGVMQNCGLTFLGEGSEPGVIRFQLLKPR